MGIKILNRETKNAYKLFNFYVMSFTFHYTFNSLSQATKWDTQNFLRYFSPYTQKDDFKIWIPGWITGQKLAINKYRPEKSMGFKSSDAEGRISHRYFRILENDVGTSTEFFLRCGVVVNLVGRWNVNSWNRCLYLLKCWNQNIIYVVICVDINPCSTKIWGNFQHLEVPAHTKKKHSFCSGKTFLTQSSMTTEYFL